MTRLPGPGGIDLYYVTRQIWLEHRAVLRLARGVSEVEQKRMREEDERVMWEELAASNCRA